MIGSVKESSGRCAEITSKLWLTGLISLDGLLSVVGLAVGEKRSGRFKIARHGAHVFWYLQALTFVQVVLHWSLGDSVDRICED
jgi:hypothetical protein